MERFLNESGTERTGKTTGKAMYTWLKREVRGLHAQCFQLDMPGRRAVAWRIPLISVRATRLRPLGRLTAAGNPSGWGRTRSPHLAVTPTTRVAREPDAARRAGSDIGLDGDARRRTVAKEAVSHGPDGVGHGQGYA